MEIRQTGNLPVFLRLSVAKYCSASQPVLKNNKCGTANLSVITIAIHTAHFTGLF
jgi:hypothetical protein